MKFKKIPEEYFVTVLDRLTRFSPAYIRYKRVFDDIINKFSLDDKLNSLDIQEEIKLVEEIVNFSTDDKYDPYLNQIILELENKYFNFNELSYQYLSSSINIYGMINKIKNNKNLPKNVLWLKYISRTRTDIYKIRKENALLYPLDKIILCEGQTEYTLLKSIFNLFQVNLDSLGIDIIQAGGKNQVARKYYNMIEYTKIPFFILLDKDAKPTSELIQPKLRKTDKMYLLNSGEFEDIIPKHILQKTINSIHCNEFECIFDDFDDDISMVECLENIYKKCGFGEFKKAKFAQQLKEYIDMYATKDDFSNSEINDILHSLLS